MLISMIVKASRGDKRSREFVLNEYRLLVRDGKEIPPELMEFVNLFMDNMIKDYSKSKDGRISLNNCFPDSPSKQTKYAQNEAITKYVRHAKLILEKNPSEAITSAAKKFCLSESAIYSALNAYGKENGVRLSKTLKISSK